MVNNIRNVCVYCGSADGVHAEYYAAAREMGAALARRGLVLVYGAGKTGLMGALADGCLQAGGEVIGVVPENLNTEVLIHAGLTRLEVVDGMHTRKARMAELSDAFIALPGGIGTLEELFEVWTWRQIGYHDKPIGLLDVDGFFGPLLAFIDRCVEEGFLAPAQRRVPLIDTDPARLLAREREAAGRAVAPDDYSRI
jgi:uncharacterized protein (TIGR00730 family)